MYVFLYGEDKAFLTFDFLKQSSLIIRFGSQLVTFVVTKAFNES